MLDLGYQVIIIECDEDQHSRYEDSCENKRTMQLSQDVNHRPIVFIRFNPDKYIKDGVTVPSCWSYHKNGLIYLSSERDWNMRLAELKNRVEYWSDPENISTKTIEVDMLFFDE